MQQIDVDVFRARLNSERARLLRKDEGRVTVGRASGLKLALSYLDEYIVKEERA